MQPVKPFGKCLSFFERVRNEFWPCPTKKLPSIKNERSSRPYIPLIFLVRFVSAVAPFSSASLWGDCQLEAMRSLHHPWTLGLATGETSRASFTKYVAQDAYFLRAFAKAYAYALTKAEDEESVRAFHSLIGSVLEELSLHSSYAVKWGVDLKNVRESNLLVPSRRFIAHMLPNLASRCLYLFKTSDNTLYGHVGPVFIV